MLQCQRLFLQPLLAITLLFATITDVSAMMVQKQRFTTSNFVTFGGETIATVEVGWESYGTLNAAKDNVILITHYFSGSSHAAGKYSEQDAEPGYWDAIIGPGKAIDTNRFFVISVDTLANLNAYDPNVITTGPATINPRTHKPYGLSFPVVTIRDFVNVQKQLLESLGVTKLYAVIGPSMGSMQAIEWAVTYPDWVPRMVSVIGAASTDAWTTSALDLWTLPIKIDPKWQQGQYTRENAPIDGLTGALMIITQQALHPAFFATQGELVGFSPLEQAPLRNIQADHSIVTWLRERAASRATLMDANHLLYLVRACQLFIAGHGNDLAPALAAVTAKTLFLPATNDLLLMPYMAKDAHLKLLAAGKSSLYQEMPGPLGHLQGVAGMQNHAQTIAQFLND